MFSVQVENLTESMPEMMPLLPLHYEELALDKDKVPLSPQWHVYEQRDANGEIIFVTVRDKGELIGYFVGFIAPGLHYSTCLTCIMDIFYVHPEHRGGNAGFLLFEFVEKELKRRNVQRVFVGSKVHLDASWLFERLGYNRVEIYYSKWLGE